MPSPLQLATLFQVFGSALVLGLSVLTLRFQPSPFFRYWVYAYAWAIVVTVGAALESVLGRSMPLFMMNSAALVPTLGYLARLGFELRGRPFPVWFVGLALGAILGLGLALRLAGLPFEQALVPGALAIMATHIWLGATMIRVGRAAEYQHMAWIGVPVLVHGLWLATYPAFAATDMLWVGFTVDAMLEIGVGAGMTVFVLLRTSRQLAQRNASLEAAEGALRAAQEVQREFLNAASHELRTPLTSVLGYADFLAEEVGGPLTDRQAEYVARIRRAADRLGRLVDEMLDFAVLEAGEFGLVPQAFDARMVVRGEAENLLPQASERQVRVALELPAAPLDAWADPMRVGQVVANLLNNAVKFSPAGGTIHMSARADGPVVRIEVRDEGVGIAAVHHPHLFRKFYRVDPKASREQGGTGLGLAISRALVGAQGGRIGVESEPGRGSTFWFTVPAVLEDKTT